MKLLHVIASMNPTTGGPAAAINNMLPAMIMKGVDVAILCLDEPDASFIPQIASNVIALGPAKNPYRFSYKMKKWLASNLEYFDAVIVNGLWLYPTYAVYKRLQMLISKNKRHPKIFIMPHGMLDPYFQQAKERRLKAIRNSFFWRFIEKRAVNDADAILFTCIEEMRLARLTFKTYNPKNEVVIGLGIDNPPSFIDISSEIVSNFPKPYLLYLSRINPKKGTDLLVQAYNEYIISNNNEDIPHLMVCGPGLDSEFGNQVKLQSKNNSKIHFVDMLSGDDKWSAFYNADAFILPSHQENFGIAVVEALACAKPVLISDKINIFTEIVNNQAGIVATDTKDGTCTLLNKWGELTKIQQLEMGKSALNLYKNDYNVDVVITKLIQIINKDII